MNMGIMMRVNQLVIQREHRLNDDDVIISTTNLKDAVASVNDDFVRISGFSEQQVIGRADNSIRHPDIRTALVSEEMNRNVVGIMDVANDTCDHAGTAAEQKSTW